MLVKNWMSKALVVVKPSASVIKAQILLKEHDISHLPVMDDGNLLGIITERDIKQLLIPSETLLWTNRSFAAIVAAEDSLSRGVFALAETKYRTTGSD